jgi:hypothetical protein
MSLRIACDLDGTIADMDAALQREATRLFGAGVDLHAPAEIVRTESAEDVETNIAAGENTEEGEGHERGQPPGAKAQPEGRPLTARELRRLWTHVAQVEDFWTSLDEIEPGALAKLHDLARARRWEVLFVTQRPQSEGATVQTQSHRWLQAHGFETPSIFVVRSGSRGRVADALGLDVVIDDRPENCLDVVTDSKAMPLLVWRLPPEALPPGVVRTGIEVVYSMQHALDRLEEVDDERARRGSFLGRLRDAILPK